MYLIILHYVLHRSIPTRKQRNAIKEYDSCAQANSVVGFTVSFRKPD